MTNKRSIPEIRERLYEIAEEEGLPELAELADETFRNPPVRRAARRSPKLTPALAAQIRVYAKSNPNAHQADIASHFNVNPGRVSEALNNAV